MNILYIHNRDNVRFIQLYGHTISTPNLQLLAEEGVLFRQCYTRAPTCSPSWAVLLTRLNPHTAGMLGLAPRVFSLKDPSQLLAHHLQQNGFETVLCGMQHLIERGQEKELGYNMVLQIRDTRPDLSGIYLDMAQDLSNTHTVADYLSQPKKQLFLLSFGMVCTHFPLPEPADDINPEYVQPLPTLPDSPETRKDMASYITLARHTDQCVGVVLDSLEENNLSDDTLVIFTTDHGVAFSWMKYNLFDHGIGVSLILRFPKGQFSGQVMDSLVSHLDIYPTLCELAGTEPPPWLEGNSLMPLIHGEAETIRSEIFGEVTYHAAYEPMRCVRTARYKYIRFFDDFENVVKPNIDDSRNKRFLKAHGLSERRHNSTGMLFDLYFDPHVRDNLVDRESLLEIKNELATQLHSWMVKTDDPLLKGTVPLPVGGFADAQDGMHPNTRLL